MPRFLRFVGALAALAWTLLAATAVSQVVALVQPLVWLTTVVLLLFASAMLLFVFLSYVFAAIVSLTGTGTPPTTFALGCAAVYLSLTTLIIVAMLVGAVFFFIYFLQVFEIGMAAFLLCALPYLLQVLIAYVLAASFAPSAPFNPALGGADNPVECWFRGNLIGMNAAMNIVLTLVFYPALIAPISAVAAFFPIAGSVAVAVSLILIVVAILAALGTCLLSATVPPPLAAAGFVHGWVKSWAGWLSWLMPMSWPYCFLGCLEFYLSWIGHFYSQGLGFVVAALTPPLNPATATLITSFLSTSTYGITEMRLDNGMITIKGGVIGNFTLAHSHGCFAFVFVSNPDDIQEMGGHHLNLAAFGTVFRLISSIHNLIPPGGDSYGQRIAESNVRPARGLPEVTLWN